MFVKLHVLSSNAPQLTNYIARKMLLCVSILVSLGSGVAGALFLRQERVVNSLWMYIGTVVSRKKVWGSEEYLNLLLLSL